MSQYPPKTQVTQHPRILLAIALLMAAIQILFVSTPMAAADQRPIPQPERQSSQGSESIQIVEKSGPSLELPNESPFANTFMATMDMAGMAEQMGVGTSLLEGATQADLANVELDTAPGLVAATRLGVAPGLLQGARVARSMSSEAAVVLGSWIDLLGGRRHVRAVIVGDDGATAFAIESIVDLARGSSGTYDWDVRSDDGTMVASGSSADPIDDICDAQCGAANIGISLLGSAVCAALQLVEPLGFLCAGIALAGASLATDLCDGGKATCVDNVRVAYVNQNKPIHSTVLINCSNNANLSYIPCDVEIVGGAPINSTLSISRLALLNSSVNPNAYSQQFFGFGANSLSNVYQISSYAFYRLRFTFMPDNYIWHRTCADELFIRTRIHASTSQFKSSYTDTGEGKGPAWWNVTYLAPYCVQYR